MAFISGTITIYKCPICGIDCELQFKNVKNILNDKDVIVAIEYRHDDNQIIFINGYPAPCENNGKMLNNDEVKTITVNKICANKRFIF